MLITELSHVTFILLRSILEDDRQARYIIDYNILENIIAGRLLLSNVHCPITSVRTYTVPKDDQALRKKQYCSHVGPIKSLSLLSPKQIFLWHPQPLNLVLLGALNRHSTLSFKVFGLYDKIFPYKCNSDWKPVKRKHKCWKTGHSSSTLWILVKNLIFRFSVLRSLLNTFPPPELPHFLLGSHIVVALRLGTQLVGAPFACVA